MAINKLQKAEKLLAQCPECNRIKFLYDKKQHWQEGIGTFEHLPAEICFICKHKAAAILDRIEL